jgi:hypothetical protein
MAARQSAGPTVPPYLTTHATERFHERARQPDASDLGSAWVDAEAVSLPIPYCFAGDEARYHRDQQVVLCRVDGVLATVYDVTGDDADRTVQLAVEKQLDVDLEVNR